MRRDQIPERRRQANYVIPQWKLVYVSNPKAACTATKWLLADALGLNPKLFYDSLSGETTRSTTIHQNRVKWLAEVPRLRDLSDSELAAISPEEGWFVFTMTRHPSLRLWSAWQSKLLLREPRFMAQFKGEPWLPRWPESSEQIIEDWVRFVQAVAAAPTQEIMRDIHFRPQAPMLAIGQTPYDRVYDTGEFATMVKDLQAHLEDNGFTGELTPRRSNETPLPALEAAFPPDVVELLGELFAADFAALSYDSPLPRKLRPGEYSDDLVAAAAIVAERDDRIGDLGRQARRLERRLLRAEELAARTTWDKVRDRLPTLRRRGEPDADDVDPDDVIAVDEDDSGN
jgi:hypothetical protein